MAHRFRFFAPSAAIVRRDAVVQLAPEDAHRVARVLRLDVGAVVEVADGAGGVFAARVEDPAAGTVRIAEAVTGAVDLAPIVVLLAQTGPRADDAVEKLVELGVSAIGPLCAAARRREARLDRWRRIAKGAAEQAKLPRVPALREPIAFADALVPGAILCSHEESDAPIGALALAPIVTLLIGPEAGFTAAEHAQARAAGVPVASLGATVLRTETAAIVAAALVRDRLAA